MVSWGWSVAFGAEKRKDTRFQIIEGIVAIGCLRVLRGGRHGEEGGSGVWAPRLHK